MVSKTLINILRIDEIKLNGSFPDSRLFQIGIYHCPPFRRERNSKGRFPT